MEQHVGIHHDGIVVERGSCDPQRGNTASVKLLVDQELDVDAACILLDRRTNHLLLVPDDDLRPANPNGSQRL